MFIDYRLAIGMLVVAGHQVRFEKHSSALRNAIVAADGTPIVMCFRDGAIYKVKEETVQDYVEDNQHLRSA